MSIWTCECGEHSILLSHDQYLKRLEPKPCPYDHGGLTHERMERLSEENDSLKARVEQLEEALGKIASSELDPSLGQIVGSEHYEGAWLDCVEIAREVIDPNCGNCGDDGEEPSKNCPTCHGTGFKALASPVGEKETPK